MRLFTLIPVLLIGISVRAQKLPNVQQTILRAPTGLKIDGRATEWGEKFQAYNAATDLYYTIANDDKRLYFVFMSSNQKVGGTAAIGGVRVNNRNLINNIVNGGIRINIQKNATKNDAGTPGIKFPYFEKGTSVAFNVQEVGSGDEGADSVMKAHNKKLAGNVKWIYTTGIAGVDTVLSIYNDKGIEAVSAFDIKRNYISEIAIDLKLLGLSVNNPTKFTYHIVANGEPNKYSVIDLIIRNGRKLAKNPDGTPMTDAQFNATMDRMRAAGDPGGATTDFWGEYILAK